MQVVASLGVRLLSQSSTHLQVGQLLPIPYHCGCQLPIGDLLTKRLHRILQVAVGGESGQIAGRWRAPCPPMLLQPSLHGLQAEEARIGFEDTGDLHLLLATSAYQVILSLHLNEESLSLILESILVHLLTSLSVVMRQSVSRVRQPAAAR